MPWQQIKKNKISSKNFISVLKKGKLNFTKVNQKDKKKFQNLHCFIQCKEETILLHKAKKYYKKKLRKNIFFNFFVKKIKKKIGKYIIGNKEYDVVINCTSLNYNYEKSKINNLLYEHCVLLLYKSLEKNHPAITIMDGLYFTLYPWDSQSNYGLYSVENSRVLSNKNFNTLKTNVKKKINNKYLNDLRKKIEKNFPIFIQILVQNLNSLNIYVAIELFQKINMILELALFMKIKNLLMFFQERLITYSMHLMKLRHA